MGRKPTGRTTRVISIRVSNDVYKHLTILVSNKSLSVNQWVKGIVIREIEHN